MPGSTRHAPGGAHALVLASASPRRSEILSTLGLLHTVEAAAADEVVLPGESPEAHVERLARAKAEAVAGGAAADVWVLAGDTVVTLDREILGKPRDREDAVGMLLRLQGRTHRVVSGLALRRRDGPVFSGWEAADVTFRAFDRAFAEEYVATGEPMDKAGAYGIQGRGAVLVTRVEGDYTAVVGLPVALLVRLLDEAGMRYHFAAGDM